MPEAPHWRLSFIPYSDIIMKEAILGISAYYHDSAAAIIVDGEIVAAAQEERFTRKKHDSSFPQHAVRYVLQESGFPIENISAIAFYEKPLIKFERLIETYHAFAPRGVRSFAAAIPVWLKEKLFLKKILKDEIAKIGETKARFLFPGTSPVACSQRILSLPFLGSSYCYTGWCW